MNRDLKWELYYNYAKDFYLKNGHLNIPNDYKIKGLKSWVIYQSKKKDSTNPLTQEQIDKLNEIHYIWDVREANWQYRYSLAKKYYEEHGHINIPQKFMIDGIDMGHWIEYQRELYLGKRNGKMPEEHKILLDKLNIKWDYLNESWDEMYNLACKYFEEHGTLEDITDLRLKHWVEAQRQANNNAGSYVNGISKKRKELLNKLYMRWGHKEKTDLFERDYKILVSYKEEFGTINIPISTVYNDIKVGNIVFNIRKKYRNHLLTDEQIEKMNNLEVIWNPIKDTWDMFYSLLEEYYVENGNSNVPQYYVVDDKKLGEWVKMQRQAKKGIYLNRITEEQIERLNALDFKWNMTDFRKEKKYKLYREYYEEYGTLNIPHEHHYKGVNLGHSINNKRYCYMNNGKISINDIVFFNSLDLDWSPKTTKLLNSKITANNKDEYYSSLDNRVNHILSDLPLEEINEIDSIDTQKEIEKEIVRRLFR